MHLALCSGSLTHAQKFGGRLVNSDEGWGSEDQKDLSKVSVPFTSLLLQPYILQPLLPLQLLSSGSAMSYALEENLLGGGFFESLLSHGIPEKLCVVWVVVVGGGTGRSSHRKQITNVTYILPFRDSSYFR